MIKFSIQIFFIYHCFFCFTSLLYFEVVLLDAYVFVMNASYLSVAHF